MIRILVKIYLEYSIIDNYREMAVEYATKDPLLSRELSNYADLVLLNFYSKVTRHERKDLMEELLPQVKKINVKNIDLFSQKAKLLLIKGFPWLFHKLIKKL